jgi:hypothetical protein
MSTSTKEELVAKAGAAAPDVPDELREKVAEKKAELLTRVRNGMQRSQERRAAAQAGGAADLGQPIVGPYVAFDLLALTPIQFGGPPPYQPSKIIAGGETAVIFTFLLVNSTVDIPNGFAIPPTVQLGGRTFRVGMEQVNLTAVTDGPDDAFQDVFTAPAPDVTVVPFAFTAPDPGIKPVMMEANFSADIVDPAQPYAAFASTIIDVDLLLVQENIPLRYLIYSD